MTKIPREFMSERLRRRHDERPMEPVQITGVLEALISNFKVVDGEELITSNNDFGSDLRYLLSKTTYSPDHITYLCRCFGEPVVVEALRRGHGRAWSSGYFAGVCRNVSAEGAA